MAKQTINIKPCPFCGNKIKSSDVIYYYNGEPYWHITCVESRGGCGVTMKGYNPEEVVEKWNKRT